MPHMSFARLFCLGVILLALPIHAQVVINEIFYHAPDDIPDLQWIELHNTSDQKVNLDGWSIAKGLKFKFSANTAIEAHGYIVICKNRQWFQKFYTTTRVAGEFEKNLKRSGEQFELRNDSGIVIDAVAFGDRPPWPVSPDGETASLERICPTAPGTQPENWAASPLSSQSNKPGGTPGSKNTSMAASLPPVIRNISFPTNSLPNEPISVEADVQDKAGLSEVALLYSVISNGSQGEEKSLSMTPATNQRYAAIIPGQATGRIVRFRIRASNHQSVNRFYPDSNDLRPAFSCLVYTNMLPGKSSWGFIIHTRQRETSTSARGNSAFVYVDAQTHQARLFDFVHITQRRGGWKIHFAKDNPLKGMTAINLIFEATDRWLLAESMAYELHRRAGLAASHTEYVRLWVDGRSLGYQLLIEQPNKSYFQRQGLRSDGNLYKATYMGSGVVGQHEKKFNVYTGYDDLIQLVSQLEGTRNDPSKQWELIKREFDVEQVISHYAARTLISDWDGFFNNYYAYHDIKGTKKWTFYPWDQDKTWGEYDGWEGTGMLYNMPLTFGAEGDRLRSAGFMGGAWWRPGGYFSRPLLANSIFRKHFLCRLKELLQTEFTEERLFPLLEQNREYLKEEVAFRAQLTRDYPGSAQKQLEANITSFKEFITKRRQWLLKQKEIQDAGVFDRAQLK